MSRRRRRPRLRRVLTIAALAGLATTLTSGPLAPTAAAANQALRTAVVVLNYNGAQYGLTPEKRAQLERAFFGTNNYSLAGYFEEASDGEVTFVPLPGQPMVLGPYETTEPGQCDNSEGDTYDIAARARSKLAADGIVAERDYDALAVFYVGWPGCNPTGWGLQPGQPKVRTVTMGTNFGGLRHEFGHAFGLDHNKKSKGCYQGTLANCSEGGIGPGASPMAGHGSVGFAAPELRAKGWFRPGQLVLAPEPGTYTLRPLHAPRDVTGNRILEIPRQGSANPDRLFVAYRAKGTIDPGTDANTYTYGVQLHLNTGNSFKFYNAFRLVDPNPQSGKEHTNLQVGKSIHDPASGLTIKTVSEDSTGAVVEITRPT